MRKIEKKLREAAGKDKKEILDASKPFFDEVLMPAFEKKREAAVIKKNIPWHKILRFAPFTALLAFIIVLTLMLIPPSDNGYLGPFKTEASDLQTINQYLKETRLYGEFGTVTLTSDTTTKKPMYFSVTHELIGDESIIESGIEIIIERLLTFDFENTNYNGRLIFLDYEVKFNELITQEVFEDISIFEFNIEAYFDTGKERFYITYYKMNIEKDSLFLEYLTELIKTKN
jgi:hypothetical protein